MIYTYEKIVTSGLPGAKAFVEASKKKSYGAITELFNQKSSKTETKSLLRATLHTEPEMTLTVSAALTSVKLDSRNRVFYTQNH